MTNHVIPEEAVQVAADLIVQGNRGACECRRSIFDKHDVTPPCSTRIQALRIARAALEAAAPHMLSHEREQTRLAHVDAVVNAETVDRLEEEAGILRGKLVRLAKEFDSAVGGTLAYTVTDGRHQMRKNAHDQLMYVLGDADERRKPMPPLLIGPETV